MSSTKVWAEQKNTKGKWVKMKLKGVSALHIVSQLLEKGEVEHDIRIHEGDTTMGMWGKSSHIPKKKKKGEKKSHK